MSNDPNALLLGRLAVHKKLITMDQLVEATAEQGRLGPHIRFDEVLLGKKFITAGQLDELIQAQRAILDRTSNPNAQGASPPAAVAQTSRSSPSVPPSPPPPMSAPHAATNAPATPNVPPPPAHAAPAHPENPGGETTVRKGASKPVVSLLQLSEPAGRADRLNGVLLEGARRFAGDIHFHPGVPVKFRIGGALTDMEPTPLGADDAESLLREGLNPAQRQVLDATGQIDFAYAIDGVGRFRVNVYRGLSGLNGVFRFIPKDIPSLADLGLPSDLASLTNFHQGLVLLTGPAGCGKSTTLASLVTILNRERNDHVLTIEDPIEYIHTSMRSLVNQRQVNRHTESFARALRAALREDPDVIVIGELRDLETISLALTAAETGHLVLGTLHTNNAMRTINRIIGAFPPNEQAQVRAMMSESMRAILSQRLLARKDGRGRVAALELLRVNKAVSNTIRENKTFQLRSMMQTGRTHGMILLDQSLHDLVKSGTVAKEEALRHVEDPRFLE